MQPQNNSQIQEVPIPEGLYERVDILEHMLFNDDHLRKIALTVSESSDRYDGVCFVVWKYGIVPRQHFLYVPFKPNDSTHWTFDTLSCHVNATTARLTEQLKQGVTFH